MQNINNIKAVYFVGIGGIGMSSLARYFLQKSIFVAGYDKTKTPLTEKLQNEHVHISYVDDKEDIPSLYTTGHKHTLLIIYTPAIPESNEILSYFRTANFQVYKRSEVLGIISQSSDTIAIAGTHAKTSVSVLTACIFKQGKTPTDAFLGGISKNLNSNVMISDSDKKTKLTITEADEYDRSFLQLSPKTALITSLDPDHLDIYGDYDNLKETFSEFVGKIISDGTLIMKKGIDLPTKNFPEKVYSYALKTTADFYAENIRTEPTHNTFDLQHPGGTIKDIRINIPGSINIENAVAASAIGIIHRVPEIEIKQALNNWRGTERRFDYVINTDQITFIDDYAHHPEELKAFINSVKELYPNKRITGIFQPHLYSRTRDFAEEFAHELSVPDYAILVPIYPAREQPIEGVDSKMILDKISSNKKTLCSKDKITEALERYNNEIVLLMGAGDIAQEKEVIKQFLLNQK
ncbi:MAG: UDP-N-acetylmuramate--L-alanine ligase [Bacteroidota bacterium]|nr:UDP-N-acetylmuramate--L-alanine ligase [Bacteroidota bacterium]